MSGLVHELKQDHVEVFALLESLKGVDIETRDAQQTIHLIDEALSRIRDGVYGICSSCGEKIPDKRLAALPYVTKCINCAE